MCPGRQVFGDATLGGAAELAEVVDTIFLSVKPQYLDRVIEALVPHVTERHLIVSIAAGVRIASLEANLPQGSRVVRPDGSQITGTAPLHLCVGLPEGIRAVILDCLSASFPLFMHDDHIISSPTLQSASCSLLRCNASFWS